jgi:UDP-N-acetylglucosamine 2-epimerase
MSPVIVCVSSQGTEFRSGLASLLTPELREAARVESNAWIKRLRLVPYADGRTMRERFTYRNDSLWWFTEIYLHKMRRIDAAVTATLALEAAAERHAPTRIVLEDADAVAVQVARAFGAARNVPIEIAKSASTVPARAWPSYLVGLTARLSRLRRSAPRPETTPRVAAFVHTAFWRATSGEDSPRQESYVGPVLDALAGRLGTGELTCVGVGPRRNFRARRWWDPVTSGPDRPAIIPVEQLAPKAAIRDALALWTRRYELAEEIVTGEAIRAAGIFRGLDLWPVLQPELEAAALLQWPWSARAMDEAGAALDALSPRAVVTYAEAGGWGRALCLEARRRGVPSIGIQHGFIYRHWLNYRHEADEMRATGEDRGFPAPDRTLLFDEQASTHLQSAGHFAASQLAITGNARLDELAARVNQIGADERAATRQSLGAQKDHKLVVLAAKRSELGHALDALVAAVAASPDVRLAIKTHPAETEEVYRSATAGASNISIVAGHADLARLLAAADAIVTMNSTVAVDGLVLGVPALVVGLPNNLSPFVEAGVMLGANGEEAIRERLHALLYDPEARRHLVEAAQRFASAHGMHADGQAAARAAEAILSLAR